MEELSSRGVVLRIGGAGTQKRFDGNPAPHPHLRCSVCGRVDDLEYPLALPEIPAGQSMGYSNLRCDVEFVGVCPMCAGVESLNAAMAVSMALACRLARAKNIV